VSVPSSLTSVNVTAPTVIITEPGTTGKFGKDPAKVVQGLITVPILFMCSVDAIAGAKVSQVIPSVYRIGSAASFTKLVTKKNLC
jgi:hypothetical protein